MIGDLILMILGVGLVVVASIVPDAREMIGVFLLWLIFMDVIMIRRKM